MSKRHRTDTQYLQHGITSCHATHSIDLIRECYTISVVVHSMKWNPAWSIYFFQYLHNFSENNIESLSHGNKQIKMQWQSQIFLQGSEKPWKTWKTCLFEKTQGKPGKLREKNWKFWNDSENSGNCFDWYKDFFLALHTQVLIFYEVDWCIIFKNTNVLVILILIIIELVSKVKSTQLHHFLYK